MVRSNKVVVADMRRLRALRGIRHRLEMHPLTRVGAETFFFYLKTPVISSGRWLVSFSAADSGIPAWVASHNFSRGLVARTLAPHREPVSRVTRSALYVDDT